MTIAPAQLPTVADVSALNVVARVLDLSMPDIGLPVSESPGRGAGGEG